MAQLRYSINPVRSSLKAAIGSVILRARERSRARRGWSQEELAFRSGLHCTYFSGVERGTRNPAVLVLGQLANTLGLPQGDFHQSAR